ncbi:MAG: hypothetical protein EZS28_037303 [Streblomastix strix]|uniref:Uncharacterized protein n=1 Tax=Streblomastix strix TaxID=222440 RepID=A0A5J4U9R8_9EUKA|nr:MAG: hypothetical protein EZS28_037303 [Streblomastix strix]
MRKASIKGQIRVTQIRAAALTKLFSNGASKEESDRRSRYASTADTVRRFFDKTGNDIARKLLSSSFNSSISMDRGKEPRLGDSAQSPGYATPSSRGELASELPPKRHQSLPTLKKSDDKRGNDREKLYKTNFICELKPINKHTLASQWTEASSLQEEGVAE